MLIKRIQVEDGFLSGLDLEFSEGLNVIIGSRGSGKTSIIELIRFCLGVEAFTDPHSPTAAEHALSILGPGSVIVTLVVDGEELKVTRTAENWNSTRKADFFPPVILSQNEIESVGLHALGRLKIIDSIRPLDDTLSSDKEAALLSYIRSETEQRRALAAELQNIRQQLRDLAEQLKDAEVQKKSFAEAVSIVEKAKPEQERLAVLSRWQAQVSVRAAFYERLSTALQHRLLRLQGLIPRTIIETWPAAAECEDPTTGIRRIAEESQELIQAAISKLQKAIVDTQSLAAGNRQQISSFDDEARALRKKLEMLQAGAGEASLRLTAITEKIGQQSALKELEKSKIAQLRTLQLARKKRLDELEEIRAVRFQHRQEIVADLNREFGPRIKVSIERAGINTAYINAIVAALRGSGIKFNEAAPLIADQISPREFVDFVETENVEALASITGLGTARAARIIERIREEGMEDILTAAIEDGVSISLLDGTEYKSTEHLSMGQRCTVILPLLLKQTVAPLIIDQPEDHLDNGFIVETLIKAIISRKNTAQLIFSTHNANIPVLGGAEQVVLMGSDGKRGFVRSSAPLEMRESVEAITKIMEGGLEAFERRGEFYHSATFEL